MDRCLFCPKPADSLEHVLPQWLFRRVAPQTGGKLQVRVGRYVDGQGYRDQRKHISLAFKARIVCTECNNGWMAQLESKVGQLLEHLVAPQFPVLARDFFDALRPDASTIALWLAKTALATSFALPGKQRLPPTFAKELSLKAPPPGVWIDFAKARISGIGAGFTKMFATINGNILRGPQTHSTGASFQFCLQVNHLLMRVGMSPDAEVGYLAPAVAFRLFPEPDRAIPQDFEFEHLNEFCHSIVLRTWLGCRGEVPTVRASPTTYDVA